MKYTTLVALSLFIVFHVYAPYHCRVIDGTAHLTNYGVPNSSNIRSYILTKDLKTAVLSGSITALKVVTDMEDFRTGLMLADGGKASLIARHIAVQDAYLRTLLESSSLRSGVNAHGMTPSTYKQKFYLMAKYCEGDPKLLKRKPLEDYLTELHDDLMREIRLR